VLGRLERHLDEDLIDRMASGWTPSARTVPVKKGRTARVAKSYRAFRRNEAKGTVWIGTQAKQRYLPPIRLNRSEKWDGIALTKPYGFPYVNR
jgi:hypothetical protein